MPKHEIPFGCACALPSLWRVVLGTEELHNGGERVLACMRCGTAGALKWTTERIEGDPHDASRIVGLERLTIAPDALAWLAAWPRRVGNAEKMHHRPDEVWFLPASSRFETEDDLHAAEKRGRETSAARYVDRLRAAGFPADPAPVSAAVKSSFWFFGASWDALHAEAADVATLIHQSSPMTKPAAWIYESMLPEGDAFIAAIAALMGDADRAKRAIAFEGLNIIKVRAPQSFAVPDAVVDAAAARIHAMTDPADAAARSGLASLLAYYDPRVAKRLE